MARPLMWLAWDSSSKDAGRQAEISRVVALAETGATNNALMEARRLVKQSPDYFGVYIGLGFVLTEKDRFAEALKAYDRAIELDGGIAGYVGRGNVLTFMGGRVAEAVAAYNKALEIATEQRSFDNVLGIARCIANALSSLSDNIDPRNSDKTKGIPESKLPVYNDSAMDTDFDIAIREVVARHKLPEAVAQAAIDAAQAVTARAPETKRLKWNVDNAPDENPAAFAWRAYAAEAATKTLHLGVIRQEDEPLAVKLVSWLRSPANRKQVPEGFDIPTKPEWITRQIEAQAEPPRPTRVVSDQERLYQAARYRSAKVA